MAGIGFRLQNLLQKNTFFGALQAYLAATVISAGPWLLSIIGLAAIGVLGRWFVDMERLVLFRTVVVYTYAGTLVLTGLLQMGVTRYLADRLYAGEPEALAPCYHWVGAVSTVLAGAAAGLFHYFAGLNASEGLAAVALFQAVTLVWIGMIFLSAAKDYMAVVRAFAWGYAASVALSLLGAWSGSLGGMLWGFAAGQWLLALMLGTRVRVEFPSDHEWDGRVFRRWHELPLLAAVGFFYNLGIWADKIVFWAGPEGDVIRGWFRHSPVYDSCIFLGYLTIVPAMALFLIRVETGFYKHYASFFGSVTGGADWAAIEEEKGNLVDALRLSLWRLLKVQGTVSLALLAGAPLYVEWLGLSADLIPLTRLAILASLMQVLLLLVLVILLYFELQKEAAVLALLFFVSNTGFSIGSLWLGETYRGMGYLVGCLLPLCVAVMYLEKGLNDLEYETFTRQPMATD